MGAVQSRHLRLLFSVFMLRSVTRLLDPVICLMDRHERERKIQQSNSCFGASVQTEIFMEIWKLKTLLWMYFVPS